VIEVKELSFEPKWREDAKRAYTTIESMGERIMTITEEDVGKIIEGACDLHLHAFPDPLIDTGWDQIEIAMRASEVGMKALLFKAHTFPTAATAPLVQEIVNHFAEERGIQPARVFGGITLNNYVGGLNPEAVKMCLRLKARIVELPSHDAAHHHKVMGEPGGIPVLTEGGQLVPELEDILGLLADKEVILGTGHCGTEEKLKVIERAREIGVKKILVTHPDWNVTRDSVEQMVEMARLGAYVGMFVYSGVPNFNNPMCDPLEVLEIIKAVKPEHLVICSDLGTVVNVHPVDGLKMFIRILLACGVSSEDIGTMLKKNPQHLLAL
jgi:hypothetical protein